MVVSALLAFLPAAVAADIYGTITFQGTPPAEIPITPLKNDPTCGPLHKQMPTTHFYRVGPQGGFADVVVSLAGVHGKSNGSEAKPLEIDQKGCEYAPYISACQTGQKIIVRNSDPVLHNVHVTPTNPANHEENRAQMPNGPPITFTFNAPEEFLRFKCDVHPWMFAYVGVFEHPFYAVTVKDGTFKITGVPKGKYTLEAYHVKTHGANPGVLQEITVDGDAKADFTIELK